MCLGASTYPRKSTLPPGLRSAFRPKRILVGSGFAASLCRRTNVLERERRDRVPYSAWIKAGYITATEGNVVDYNAVEDRIVKDCEKYMIQEVGFDA